jgi:CHASE2 domain/CHAT domain
MAQPLLRLKVQQIDQICLFDLIWGQGQQLTAHLLYPTTVLAQYQAWQQAYLNFYKTVPLTLEPTDRTADDVSIDDVSMRGWSMAQGQGKPTADHWQRQLIEAEILLLKAFHHWLGNPELAEIRVAIAQALTGQFAKGIHPATNPTPTGHAPRRSPPFSESRRLLLSATPVELARLPWETWPLGQESSGAAPVEIIRTAGNIPAQAGKSSPSRAHRSRLRILAILGDDTGLNFQADRAAMQTLSNRADLTFVGWQPGQTADELKGQISRALSDSIGWDVLFFAGHSNETVMTGGEVALAPQITLSMRELIPQLTQAKDRGLQVALFNSCSGVPIAESLIALGFGQVIVMREPIHNRVAQTLLYAFVGGLAQYQTVQAALVTARRALQTEYNLTLPSAYLLPSLFCHPGAELFRLHPPRWQTQARHLIPRRIEALTLAGCLALSLWPAAQQFLLDSRVWVQAGYRDLTSQVPPRTTPPVLLVQIDTVSITRNGIAQVQPIDRRYLAQLIQQLSARHASIVGIDFVLDTPQPGDQELRHTLQQAIAQTSTWFVFAAILENNQEIGLSPAVNLAQPSQVLQGYTDADPTYVMLPVIGEDCRELCPFAYLLSLLKSAQQTTTDLPSPQLEISDTTTTALRTRLIDSIAAQSNASPTTTQLQQMRLLPLSLQIYNLTGLHWLEPIIDFSIPPDRVYQRIAAWQLLDQSELGNLPPLSDQIVILGLGADERTGLVPGAPDRYPLPPGLKYWNHSQYWLTGGEALAYMVHHQLNHRLVIPLPDLGFVGLAVLSGKTLAIALQQSRARWHKNRQKQYFFILTSATCLYGVLSLQLYVSAALLLPWLLPSIAFWAYLLPEIGPKSHDEL